jgi:hypothetical protein
MQAEICSAGLRSPAIQVVNVWISRLRTPAAFVGRLRLRWAGHVDPVECPPHLAGQCLWAALTVIQEVEYDSIEHFMQDQAAMFSDPRWQDTMQPNRNRDLIISGSKKFYTIEMAG